MAQMEPDARKPIWWYGAGPYEVQFLPDPTWRTTTAGTDPEGNAGHFVLCAGPVVTQLPHPVGTVVLALGRTAVRIRKVSTPVVDVADNGVIDVQ